MPSISVMVVRRNSIVLCYESAARGFGSGLFFLRLTHTEIGHLCPFCEQVRPPTHMHSTIIAVVVVVIFLFFLLK